MKNVKVKFTFSQGKYEDMINDLNNNMPRIKFKCGRSTKK